MLTPKNRTNNSLATQGVTTFFVCSIIATSLLALASIFSRDSCERLEADCIKLNLPGKEVPILAVPSGVFGSIIGAFSGALFTFGAFNLLEIKKLIREPRPELVASFEPEQNSQGQDPDFSCLIVDSHPHYVQDRTETLLNVGTASYLRIKVLNNGSIVCKNVRAYLTQIDEKTEQGWKRLSSYKESMALLWAYEGRQDYFIPGHGIDLPSKATSFADVLVSYDNFFTPKLRPFDTDVDQEAGKQKQNVWYLKLKTKRQPINHIYILEIAKSSNLKWKLTIEVYGDHSEPSKVCLFIAHTENDQSLQVYTEEMQNSQRLKLHHEDNMAERLNQLDIDTQSIYSQF